jgi:hypothetical protein
MSSVGRPHVDLMPFAMTLQVSLRHKTLNIYCFYDVACPLIWPRRS